MPAQQPSGSHRRPDAPPSGAAWILLIISGLAAAGLGVVVYNRRAAPAQQFTDAGFNLSQVNVSGAPPAPAAAPSAGAASPTAMPPNRLFQASGADAGFRGPARLVAPAVPGSAQGAVGAGNPADRFTEAVRRNETRYDRLAREYSKKYPVIRQYGRDWMKYKDLKSFNDQYFQDHDPIKFAKNVASSPNFAALVRQYANRPEMIAFVTDAARSAPGELMGAAQDYLKSDTTATNLLRRFASALGLPPPLVAGVTGGQVDGTQAAADLINGNPQMQRLLQQNNVDPNQPAPAAPAPVGTR